MNIPCHNCILLAMCHAKTTDSSLTFTQLKCELAEAYVTEMPRGTASHYNRVATIKRIFESTNEVKANDHTV